MKIVVKEFTGIAPRMGAKELAANAAQAAENVRLESGELRPFGQGATIAAAIVANALSVFPLGGPTFRYLSWATDVDVARSPLADDEGRIYYTGDGKPKKTNLALAGATGIGPASWLYLGVPGPTTAPVLLSAATGAVATQQVSSVTAFGATGLATNAINGNSRTSQVASAAIVSTNIGGAGAGTSQPTNTVSETRVYVYTYISSFGSVLEESAPSPPATITLVNNAAAQVNNLANPTVTAGYNYVSKRLYRSVGAGALQLVAELPIATTSYIDSITADKIPGDVLPSTEWMPPPDDLVGITLLPGGVLVGFRNNEIWFSEPEFPHAWPAKYMQTVNAKVVAIKAFSNTLAVATQAYPEVGTGLHPESFTFSVVPVRAPCVSKRSMASDDAGAMYASDQGLVSLGIDGNGLVSGGVYRRYEFAALNPTTLMGVVFDRKYFGFYTVEGVTRAIVFQRGDMPPLTTLSLSASAASVEPISNKLVVYDPVQAKLLYVDPIDNGPMSFYWKSKVFELPQPTSMSALRITVPGDTPDQAALTAALALQNAANMAFNQAAFASGATLEAVNASLVNEIPVGGTNAKPILSLPPTKVTVYVWADSRLIFSAQVVPQTVVRLPSGFMTRNWEVAVSAQRNIQSIEMATSVSELA